jgi:hypothetical protein
MRRWIVRAAVSAVAIVVLLNVVPLGSVVEALGRIDPWTWLASLGIFFAGHYLNALKLRLLIGRGNVPIAPCVQAQYAGLVANLSLPGLAGGDLVRAAYLAPTAGMRRVVVASLVDRVLDTVTLLALVALALPFAGIPPTRSTCGSPSRPGSSEGSPSGACSRWRPSSCSAAGRSCPRSCPRPGPT